ncbi:glycoside hydrolase family 3 protein [Actinomadura namibiensis]|uniref:beta-N-acetylhexosaminidase n=1 Tax=Actinomadura namibiensis TaxID=182080 RepID=A0A7W3QM38_ACTNM|nr:glycoside hydrolase family 3 protein [Actinomadura namibiensis]MBA8951613.1 beta-N-acetylhexosaminidase [Actinomadura namibiensis]
MRVPPRSLALGAATLTVLPLAACDGRSAPPPAPSAATTSPAAAAGQRSAGDAVPALVRGMTVEEQVGQLFVPTFASEAAAKQMIRKYRVGGFIYFPGNLRSARQTARLSNALQSASKVPLLLGTDEEQGLVTRVPFLTRFPGNMALGATRDPEQARAAARVTGTELRAIGINQDYAPVADVNVNPANPVIGVRSFGADPALVARMLGGAITGYREAGVAATAKHFPGHGDTATDSHTGLPVIRHSRAEWERLDAPPFRAAVAAGVDAIMSAHIVMPKLDRSGDPATLSRTVLTGLLRGELGYRGVVVTDSLQMAGARRRYGEGETAVRAVNAGADQLLMPPNLDRAHRAVLGAVRSGRISRQRLTEAVSRILRMKEQRGLFRGTRVDPARAAATVGSPAHRAVARRVAERSVTLVRNEGGTLPLGKGARVRVTGPRAERLAAALRRAGVRTTSSAGADVTVLTSSNGDPSARVRAVRGGRVVVAAIGRPYDLNGARGADAALATYSPGDASLAALSRVLTGAVKPTGKLPAPAGGPAGHGLTYR